MLKHHFSLKNTKKLSLGEPELKSTDAYKIKRVYGDYDSLGILCLFLWGNLGLGI